MSLHAEVMRSRRRRLRGMTREVAEGGRSINSVRRALGFPELTMLHAGVLGAVEAETGLAGFAVPRRVREDRGGGCE